MSATDRLERILYILAVASRPGGARLEDVARALGVDIGTIVRDVQQVTDREFYHPAGSADALTIMLGKGTIRVGPGNEFTRPARLAALETLALGLGLRALATDHAEPRRSEILELAERLEHHLRAPEFAMRPRSTGSREEVTPQVAASALAFGEDDARATLADAARNGNVCLLDYLRPGSGAVEQRRIVPVRLVHAAGRWYVAARDLDRDRPRIFRLDRILRLEVSDECAVFADDPDAIEEMARQGMVYISEETVAAQVRVRYSRRVARWVAEHVNAPLDEDGTLTLTHDVSDPDWLVRHILQYGGDAVVEAGPLRDIVATAAERLSA